jgi:hypothetical protein
MYGDIKESKYYYVELDYALSEVKSHLKVANKFVKVKIARLRLHDIMIRS